MIHQVAGYGQNSTRTLQVNKKPSEPCRPEGLSLTTPALAQSWMPYSAGRLLRVIAQAMIRIKTAIDIQIAGVFVL